MNLTCYVVDDELHAVEMLSDYIQRTEGLELLGYSTDPVRALNAVTGHSPPDITFLDVEMPELSGMEFAGLANLHTRIVFTTAFQEFALEAFEKEAFDFLLKPISHQRFRKCVQRIERTARSRDQEDKRDFFFVKSEIKGKAIKVWVNDILYVEGAQNYIRIHLPGATVMPYLTMTEMQQYLPAGQFARIHQSYLINNDRVSIIEPGQVTLEGNIKLSIGRYYKERFLAQMAEHLLKSKRQP